MPPDFRTLMSKPANAFKKPPLLVPGTYQGAIGPKYELLETQGKDGKEKNPYVRYEVKIHAPGDDVDSALLVDDEGRSIDLSKMSFRLDFYFTEKAGYRFNEFCESVGVPHEGRSLGELIPELTNKQVLVQIIQRASQDGQSLFNEIKSAKGL